MDEMVADVVVLSTIVKLRVIGKLHSSMIVHADRSRRSEVWRRAGVLRRLSLHSRIVMMFSYISRKRFNIASFNFAEESSHPDDLLGGLGEGDVLCLGRGQGNDVLFLSFP